MARTRTIVVMGVAGSGKSTVMRALVDRLGWAWAEADDFHPASSVAKMARGIPLTDEDRLPWIESIARWIGDTAAARKDSIVTCSALKRAYRDRLRKGNPSVWFAHLMAPREVLVARIEERTHHYMPASLLPSQLDALEPLGPDEPGAEIDATGGVEAAAAQILAALPELD